MADRNQSSFRKISVAENLCGLNGTSIKFSDPLKIRIWNIGIVRNVGGAEKWHSNHEHSYVSLRVLEWYEEFVVNVHVLAVADHRANDGNVQAL